MSDRDEDFRDSYYYRAIRTRIGAALRAQLDMSQPLPDRISALLTMLGREDAVGPPIDAEPGASGRGAGEPGMQKFR